MLSISTQTCAIRLRHANILTFHIILDICYHKYKFNKYRGCYMDEETKLQPLVIWFWPKVIYLYMGKETTYSRRQLNCTYHCWDAKTMMERPRVTDNFVDFNGLKPSTCFWGKSRSLWENSTLEGLNVLSWQLHSWNKFVFPQKQ